MKTDRIERPGTTRATSSTEFVSARYRTPTGNLLKRPWLWIIIIGPGLMVMLADTDAGSIITAAQSGAQWSYSMILPQLLLIPFLYVVQEMTVRLGLITGKGHGELIRKHFGVGWAFIFVFTLFLSAVGALVTEFVGIAGVGNSFTFRSGSRCLLSQRC